MSLPHESPQTLVEGCMNLILIPLSVTTYRSHYFIAKFLKKPLRNINLKKYANPYAFGLVFSYFIHFYCSGRCELGAASLPRKTEDV